jgi:hypothetical protein
MQAGIKLPSRVQQGQCSVRTVTPPERVQPAYQDHRDVLLRTLVSHANDIPKSFLEGIFLLYDRVMLCVVMKNQEAALFLDLAAKKLSGYPRYTTNFLNVDLNILLLGKGMEVGSDCNESISKVISSGV